MQIKPTVPIPEDNFKSYQITPLREDKKFTMLVDKNQNSKKVSLFLLFTFDFLIYK